MTIPANFNSTQFEIDHNCLIYVEDDTIVCSKAFNNLEQLIAENCAKYGQTKAAEARRHDFINEADPLYFGWQRGENTEQEWLDKVAEIRARHPYA